MHLAIATQIGSDHVNVGQPSKVNNQDAWTKLELESGFIVVLCDGCGSYPLSGTGADIGASIIAHTIRKQLVVAITPDKLDWRRITEAVVNKLKESVQLFRENNTVVAFETAVTDRFLFTAVVLVVVDDMAVVATLGDGVVIIDDEITIIDPPLENMPPYMGYLLLRDSRYHRTPELRAHMQFSVVDTIVLSALKQGVIIGTDGLKCLVKEDLHHPALVQPKGLQRWLNVMTMEKIDGGNLVRGKCRDDVTLAIVRTDEAQRVMLEKQVPIAELKGQLALFTERVNDVANDLDIGSLLAEEALKGVARLTAVLDIIEPRTKELGMLGGRVVELRQRIESIRRDIPEKARKPPPPLSVAPLYKVVMDGATRILTEAEIHKAGYRLVTGPESQPPSPVYRPPLGPPILPPVPVPTPPASTSVPSISVSTPPTSVPSIIIRPPVGVPIYTPGNKKNKKKKGGKGFFRTLFQYSPPSVAVSAVITSEQLVEMVDKDGAMPSEDEAVTEVQSDDSNGGQATEENPATGEDVADDSGDQVAEEVKATEEGK